MAVTKSLGQKSSLDKFYTQASVAYECIQLLGDLKKFDCIIEPSAGNGSFSHQIPNCKAYDIEPEADDIQYADWFELDKTQFKHYKNILIIGNPPFGQQNTLAIIIAFILPLSFKKRSIQNKLDLNFHLIEEKILDKKSFLLNEQEYAVPCVFQIWERKDIKRIIQKNKTTTNLFSFVDKENADFRIQRVGGNAGKASFNLNYSPESNYFIKNNTSYSNEEFVDMINNEIIFPEIEYTVGPRSLSKTELILTIEDYFNKKNNK